MWAAPLLFFDESAPLAVAAGTFNIQAAAQVDSNRLLSTDPGQESKPATADADLVSSKQQLYGKSLCYCPATAMYIASLGNAQDEDQNVTWLMTVNADGTSIGQMSSVIVATLPVDDSAAGDSASASAESAVGESAPASTSLSASVPPALQHPDPESDAENALIEEEDDLEDDDEEEEDKGEDESEEDSGDVGILPCVERSYVVPLLPAARQEMQTPALVLGVPSHGLPGLVATVFESAHSDGTGCELVTQIQDMQVDILHCSLLC